MRAKLMAFGSEFFYQILIALVFLPALAFSQFSAKKEKIREIPEKTGVALLPSPSSAMVIPVTVNGRQLKFQVDTGSRRTILINPSLAFISSEDDCTISGAIKGASIRCYHSTLDQIKIGEIVAHDVHVLIIPLAGSNFDEGIDGILGLDFMRNYKVTFDEESFALTKKEAQ